MSRSRQHVKVANLKLASVAGISVDNMQSEAQTSRRNLKKRPSDLLIALLNPRLISQTPLSCQRSATGSNLLPARRPDFWDREAVMCENNEVSQTILHINPIKLPPWPSVLLRLSVFSCTPSVFSLLNVVQQARKSAAVNLPTK